MKNKLVVALCLLTLFATRASSQTAPSTEGRDFWVALTYGTAPDGKITARELFLAVSAREDCQITVTNPNTEWTGVQNYEVKAGTWTTLSTDVIPYDQWWPGEKRDDINGKTLAKGLHVTSTKDISLFAAMRYEFSFDASMVLPTHVLQKEYIVQDYPPYDHNNKTSWSSYAILAVEEGTTTVQITALGARQPQVVSLTQGQVYYVVSGEKVSLSGTHILADKAVAVFNGDVCTDVPGRISARDLTYEQAMPVDYWGTEFVVTRSLNKDANRVRVTAQVDDTEIIIDDESIATINAGETYEFEMSEGTGKLAKIARTLTESGIEIPDIFKGEAHYIQTSCPCAVYCYEVSEKYANNFDDEDTSLPTEVLTGVDKDGKPHNLGDPSMVWISPLEQRIKQLTFGVCPTDHVTYHNINIVVLTSDVENVVLSSKSNNNIALDFKELAGTAYSYARQRICDSSTSDDQVFTLSCPSGFIAHIYGNGLQESYAYSAGSSAVALGSIHVGNQVFQDGGFSDEAYCVNDELTFDASAGTTIIDKVEWDFGDGTSTTITDASTTHKYTTPGWFDVTAKLYAHKDCPATTYPPFDVSFTFRVIRPDTIRHITDTCVGPDYQGRESYSIEKKYDCDSVVITQFYVLHKSYKDSIHTAQDIAYVHGETYTEDAEVEWIEKNSVGCDSVTTCQIRIRRCLNLEITNDAEAQQICAGARYDLPLSIAQGSSAGNVYLIVNGKRTNLGYLDRFAELEDEGNRRVGTIELPIDKWKPGRYQASIEIEDLNCGDKNPAQSPVLDFLVKYPETVLTFKFNNILAVLNKANNGGYDFRGFQWYRNGEAIPDEITAVYYTDAPFTPGDVYYVMLTDKNNVTLPSCEFIVPEDLPNYNEPQQAPAKKVLVGRQMCIMKDGMVFDVYGQRIQ